VGAGAITQKVHQAAAQHGLTWPIDLASKGSCQIGGNLATNAGGLRVIRYGHTRQWVLGLSALLMDGTRLELDAGLHKDNCGPDLRQLMIGSEGILGVITSATLKLTPLPRHSQVVLLAIQDLNAALEVVRQARVEVQLPLLAVEFLSRNCLEAVMKVQGFACPVSQMPSALLLLEVEEDERLSGLLENWLGQGLVSDGVVSANSQERARLWAYRERITESLGSLGLMHKNDVSLEVARLPEFFEQLGQRDIGYPGQVFLFGHLGDGNVHVNVMKPAELPAEEFWPACKVGDHRLYQLISELGGSISAEHGIGLLKRDYLHYCRSPQALQTLAAIKHSLDPKGLLNPGKVISPQLQKAKG
jgi:FAD/FMN-containing dehydrogenase